MCGWASPRRGWVGSSQAWRQVPHGFLPVTRRPFQCAPRRVHHPPLGGAAHLAADARNGTGGNRGSRSDRRVCRSCGRSRMSSTAQPRAEDVTTPNRRLAVLLAMAMFVLVVDTSLMNVSISAVVRDLHTTVSGVQSTIALEALVSAAFILIGSKVGDLIGRKRAYVLGLLGYAAGAIAMTLAQSLTAVIIFWAIIG